MIDELTYTMREDLYEFVMNWLDGDEPTDEAITTAIDRWVDDRMEEVARMGRSTTIEEVKERL